MCGICGVYHYGVAQSTLSEAMLASMANTMSHRGPDDAGVYLSRDKRLGLGFRRLAIIDLSHAGNQPMPNEDGTLWVVMNGEIYNYKHLAEDLKRRGHRFRSRTDTEVLVHLYEDKGVKLVDDLAGMFAFAIWDEEASRLTVVRDRIGIKPLYYVCQDGCFIFASEIKALLKYPGLTPSINEQALYDYLTYSVVPVPDTLFEGIQKLAPGHVLTIENDDQARQERYWNVADYLPNPKGPERSVDYYVDRIRELLRESVKARMISDVPFGVFLSGGIDSSTNVALMAELMDRPVQAFSVGFKSPSPYNEMAYARRVADQFDAHYHEVLIDDKDFLELLPRLAYIQDEPLSDPVCVPLYYLARLAKESGVTVIQVGEGSDELFAGYEGYRIRLDRIRRYWEPLTSMPSGFLKAGETLASLFLPLRYREFAWRAANSSEYAWGSAIAFGEIQKRCLLKRGFLDSVGTARRSDDLIRAIVAEIPRDRSTDDLTCMIYAEFRHRLPELLLMRVDKIAMAHALEARVPFLDHRLVEFALGIPSHLKIRGGVGKYILKRVVESLLPNDVIHRPKIGFAGSASNMLTPAVKSFAHDLIRDTPDLFQWLNSDCIEMLFKDTNDDHSFRIWNLMNLALWYNEWVRR